MLQYFEWLRKGSPDVNDDDEQEEEEEKAKKTEEARWNHFNAAVMHEKKIICLFQNIGM